jgi:hypothetical protein
VLEALGARSVFAALGARSALGALGARSVFGAPRAFRSVVLGGVEEDEDEDGCGISTWLGAAR